MGGNYKKRLKSISTGFVSAEIANKYENFRVLIPSIPIDPFYDQVAGTTIVTDTRVDVNLVDKGVWDINQFINKNPQFKCNYKFICKGGFYKNVNFLLLRERGQITFLLDLRLRRCQNLKLNVVNPDDIINKYGADTLRLYEMFLGPLEQSKPWNTSGIEGVAKFLRRFYRLFVSDKGDLLLTDAEAHRTASCASSTRPSTRSPTISRSSASTPSSPPS